MNVNFGRRSGKTRKADRKQMYTGRAREAMQGWMKLNLHCRRFLTRSRRRLRLGRAQMQRGLAAP